MYEFIQPNEQPVKRTRSLRTIFNSMELDDALTDENGEFITLSVTGRGSMNQRINTIDINQMDGVYEEGEPTLEPRTISVRFKIADKTNTGFQERITRLRAYLKGAKKVLSFTDEDAIFYATMSSLELPEETSNVQTGVIYFFCSDPYKYGQEQTLHFPSDLVSIQNKGTAPADPIFELTATKKATFAMIGNQDDEYIMLGQPADDDVQEVDARTSVLYENGNTIDDWTHTENRDMISNDLNISNLDGVMGSDGAGIRASNYGTSGTGQRGPAAFKELPNAIQDFEMQTTFDIISNYEIENFRMMVYFLDENMNSIGHIGLKDNSRNYKRRVALSQLGAHMEGVTLIGDNDHIVDDSRDNTVYYLRFKREGRRFTAYVAYVRSLRHQIVWSRTFNDVSNDFLGRLKYVTLFIGSYQDRRLPSRIRMNNVEVFELQTIEEDQTPYIVYPGDVIEFDHVNDGILLNGQVRPDLFTSIGADFFKLKEGENRLAVTPENSFETLVRFRDRYR